MKEKLRCFINKTSRMFSLRIQTKYHQKDIIRAAIKKRKENLTDSYKEEQAEIVYAKIEHMPEFKRAKTIFIYWSTPDELPTHNFIKKWSRSKIILLPVVKGNEMSIKPFISENKLVRGSFKIMEPSSGEDYLQPIDLAIVPGIAFDRKKRRLGRGKGYYDRYFKNKNIRKWGIGFDLQLCDNIPVTSQDIKMDRIITPSETIW